MQGILIRFFGPIERRDFCVVQFLTNVCGTYSLLPNFVEWFAANNSKNKYIFKSVYELDSFPLLILSAILKPPSDYDT